ncbi:alpha/beta hydrolase [Acinetobacter wanghuae]|uniref:Alpha/beta hydrolase n=1 Tax=Acinetobacter wanghuae TaxID=2662362 RepID=A0A5Q0P2D4_9GAMM|nr:alpha/beta fold hydrolase [Acinetobacter wanghuae]MQW91541.1 alpha/beta hydrolase [Acinetobacter wanghuae]QGA10896.1 alpha/beta hydrolase [Acinetobacter wanghuae]
MHYKMNKALWLCSAIFLSSLTGCQVVSVKNQKINVSISNERDSILTRDKLSEASLNVLSMTGRESKNCMNQPEQCVEELQKIPQILDEQLLSTASELFLAKSIQLGKSSECKTSVLSKTQSDEKQLLQKQTIEKCLDTQLAMLDKSIRYSYAYLFKTERVPQDRIFDNRQVQIRDFYNLAIAHLVQAYNQRHTSTEASRRLQIGESIYHVDFEFYPQLKEKKAEQLLSTYNMNFSGLRSVTRRDGFGSEFLVVMPEDKNPPNTKAKYIVDPLNHKYPNGINPNIHDARYLATTITAQPKSQRDVKDILTNPEFHLKLYDPYKNEKVKIAGRDYPLAANFSAPYGLWLAENNLGRSAYLSLIDRDDQILMPHLYMLEPYNPDKKVIVLVHGLASSPEAWIRLTNDIMGDPVLRENFQVWQVFYSTNMPILESRFQIHSIVTQAFDQVQPNAAAAKDAVLIGHSMGGIISRLLVSNADLVNDTQKLVNNRKLDQFKNNPLFKARLQMQAIPQFDRAIFLASPHRGTDYADRWFTRAARKIIKLPGAFLGAFADTLQGQIGLDDFVKELGHGIIQNGPSDLSKNSKFTQLTKDITPYKGFKFHSIMGNNTGLDDLNLITDDIVPYRSAHLEGAISEKILKGGHSIQETPEAVLELRRILRLHLTELGIYKP